MTNIISETAAHARRASWDIAVRSGKTAQLHALLQDPNTPVSKAYDAVKRFHDAAFDAGHLGAAVGVIGVLTEVECERRRPLEGGAAIELTFENDAKGG